MKDIKIRSCFLAAILLISSCSTFNSITGKAVLFSGADKDYLQTSIYILDKVIIVKDFDNQSVKTNAEYILKTILLNQKPFPENNTLFITAVLKEEIFIKKNTAMNSVTLELTVFKNDKDTPEAFCIISEETINTLASYPYLYRLIRKGLKRLYIE